MTASVEEIRAQLEEIVDLLDSPTSNAPSTHRLSEFFAYHQAIRLSELAKVLSWQRPESVLKVALEALMTSGHLSVTTDWLVVGIDLVRVLSQLSRRCPAPALLSDVREELRNLTLRRLDRTTLDTLLKECIPAVTISVGGEEVVYAYRSGDERRKTLAEPMIAVLQQFPAGASAETLVEALRKGLGSEEDLGAIVEVLNSDSRFTSNGNGHWSLDPSRDWLFLPPIVTEGEQVETYPDTPELTYVIVKLLMEVVLADGVILWQEQRVIVDFFRQQLGYTDELVPKVLRLMERAREDRTPLQLVAESIVAADMGLKELLMQTAVEIAMCDGELHPSEGAVLHEIGDALQVDPSFLVLALEAVAPEQDTVASGRLKSLRILGLSEGASALEAWRCYHSLLDRYRPGKLARYGREFAELGHKRRKTLQLAFEQLQADEDFWRSDELEPDPAALLVRELDLSDSLRVALQASSLIHLSSFCSVSHRQLVTGSYLSEEHLAELAGAVSRKYPILFARDQNLRRGLLSAANAVEAGIVPKVLEVLDLAEQPLKQQEIRSRLDRGYGLSISNGELSLALESAHRQARVFYCGASRWSVPRHLSLSAELTASIRRRALAYLESAGSNGEVLVNDGGWLEAVDGASPAQVDFTLATSSLFIKVRHGTYALRNQEFAEDFEASSDPPARDSLPVGFANVSLREYREHAEATLSRIEWNIISARFGFRPTTRQMTIEEVSRALGAQPRRIAQLEKQAQAKLRKAQLTRDLRATLKRELEAHQGWLSSKELSPEVFDAGEKDGSAVLRMLPTLCPELEVLSVGDSLLLCDSASEVRQLQELKYQMKGAFALPATLARVSSWVSDSRPTPGPRFAERVVKLLWNCRSVSIDGVEIVYALDDPELRDELSFVLFLADGAATPEQLAEEHSRHFKGAPLAEQDIVECLSSNPRRFLQVDENEWTLLSNTRAVREWPSLASRIRSYLLGEGEPCHFDAVLAALYETNPSWLNEHSLRTLVRSDDSLEVVEASYLRPRGSQWPIKTLKQSLLDVLAEHDLEPARLEASLRKHHLVEGSGLGELLGDLSKSGLIERRGELWTLIINDELVSSAEETAASLSPKSMELLATWWTEGRQRHDCAVLGRLLLQEADDVCVEWASSSDASDDIRALRLLPREQVAPVRHWWQCWANRLGHKRVAEVFLKTYRSLQKPREAIRAQVTAPKEEIVFLEKELDSPAFFVSKYQGTSLQVIMNTAHPFYEVVRESLQSETSLPVRLLLASWAMYETEQPEGVRKERAGSARIDWGRVVRRVSRERDSYEGLTSVGNSGSGTITNATEARDASSNSEEELEVEELLILAEAHQRSGRYGRAIEVYTRLLRTGENADWYFWRGVCYFSCGSFPEALRDLSRACEIRPQDAEFLNEAGVVCMKLGRCVQAHEYFRAAVSLEVDIDVYHYNLAKSLGAMSRFSEALVALEKADTISDDGELLSDISGLREEYTQKCGELGRATVEAL